MQTVKAQPLLAAAFVRALQLQPALRDRLRLVMVGDGPLRAQAQAVLASAGVEQLAWLPGERADVPDVMRGLDCFVLPSLAEGISNTILEAMASGLPVVATDVGGNAGTGGRRADRDACAGGDVEALAAGIAGMAGDPARAAAMGAAGSRCGRSGTSACRSWWRPIGSLYDRLLAATTHDNHTGLKHMCGITGIFDTRGARPIDRAVLQRMNDSQLHRGPDEGSLHIEPGLGFGHRRLSIIDIATGQQPLFNEDGSVVVVFNGEIYNFQELIPELQAAGPPFPHQERHRSHRARLGAVGRGLCPALPRHVRLRAVGPQPPDAVHGARPAGREAACTTRCWTTARCCSAPS